MPVARTQNAEVKTSERISVRSTGRQQLFVVSCRRASASVSRRADGKRRGAMLARVPSLIQDTLETTAAGSSPPRQNFRLRYAVVLCRRRTAQAATSPKPINASVAGSGTVGFTIWFDKKKTPFSEGL
jgi:hypothetical protein